MRRFLQGGRAEVEYTAAPADALILLFREGRRQFGAYREAPDGIKPTLNELKKLTSVGDFLVFPIDLSWTAFFHHEDWVPTYFAYRDWMNTE